MIKTTHSTAPIAPLYVKQVAASAAELATTPAPYLQSTRRPWKSGKPSSESLDRCEGRPLDCMDNRRDDWHFASEGRTCATMTWDHVAYGDAWYFTPTRGGSFCGKCGHEWQWSRGAKVWYSPIGCATSLLG